jgi:tRNA threonylcarbamoyladenosine biosynthesis protein TsaB
MTVLGIETATRVCGAALAVEGKTVAHMQEEGRNIHAGRLMEQVEEVMRASGVSARGLDGIAVSIGPGSFTGLRIGLSVAKGLAFARGTPLLGVPTLSALAERIVREGSPADGGLLLAALEARRGEVYCQLFTVIEGGARPVSEVRDRTLGEVAELIAGRDCLVTGEGAEIVAALSAGGGGPRLRLAEAHLSRSSAAVVALMGEELLLRGEHAEAALLEPQYIKEFFFRTRP